MSVTSRIGIGRLLRRSAKIVVGVVVVLIVALLLLPPPGVTAIQSHPNPARDFADAMRRARAIEMRDTPDVNPDCRTRLRTHGTRTRDVLVLIHGLTNCPKQFDLLAERFHARDGT